MLFIFLLYTEEFSCKSQTKCQLSHKHADTENNDAAGYRSRFGTEIKVPFSRAKWIHDRHQTIRSHTWPQYSRTISASRLGRKLSNREVTELRQSQTNSSTSTPTDLRSLFTKNVCNPIHAHHLRFIIASHISMHHTRTPRTRFAGHFLSIPAIELVAQRSSFDCLLYSLTPNS